MSLSVGVALATALYLLLGRLAFSSTSRVLNMLLLPAVVLLLLPMPLLRRIGLHDRGWLVAGPSRAGHAVLVALYAAGAWLVTESIRRAG